MTKTLTEQWREGTLQDGLYYVKTSTFNVLEEPVMEKCIRGVLYIYGVVDYNAKEVLAPVPSYDEYQGLLSDQLAKNEATEINAELEHKVERLQEQLNEANEVAKWYDGLENILVGWELATGQPKGTARKYLEKWGVK